MTFKGCKSGMYLRYFVYFCVRNEGMAVIYLRFFVYLCVTEMKAWLYKNGPISIGINAFAMQVRHPVKHLLSH